MYKRQTFDRATDEGFGIRDRRDPEHDFYEQIRGNNEVFSAFRTHRMQNDIASQLLDGKGKLKPFHRFEEDVQRIIGTYNTAWLETEYDTAVIRAHQAADWRVFERDGGILPNLRWMPTTSAEPDPVHAQFWGIELTLPKGHRFWKSHRPGDRWNCKCSLEQTDEPATSEYGIPLSDYIPSAGLDNNPGEDAKIFSDTHPYIANAYPTADKAVKDFLERRKG